MNQYIWKQANKLVDEKKVTYLGMGSIRNSLYFDVAGVKVSFYTEGNKTLYTCDCKQHGANITTGNVLCSYVLAAQKFYLNYLEVMKGQGLFK